jgi:hypothetical protein
LFAETPTADSIHIDRLDLDSGARESWLDWKPKDLAGVNLRSNLISISQDGRWIAISFRSQLGELYSSSNLE